MRTKSPFVGLSAFPITPADREGRVDTDAFAILLDQLVVDGVGSIAILGSTGAYAYLDRDERCRAVAAAVEALSGRAPLIVGVGAHRTSWVQELARDSERAGADALLLAPISYTPLTDDEVGAHYEAAAGATGLPLCIYNNPGTTHFTFSDALIGRLSRVPGIAAVKMPLPLSGDFGAELGRLRGTSPDGFAIGYSGDWGAAAGLLAGADAWYSAIAGVLPRPFAALARAADRRDAAAVSELDGMFEPLWALLRAHGSLRVAYAVASLLGLPVGEPPLPIRPIPARAWPDLERALDALGPLNAQLCA